MMQDYADRRISILRHQLETELDMDRMRQIQGSIKELKRFQTLRDEVVKGAE